MPRTRVEACLILLASNLILISAIWVLIDQNKLKVLEFTHLILQDEPIQIFEISDNNVTRIYAASNKAVEGTISLRVDGTNIEIAPKNEFSCNWSNSQREPVLTIKQSKSHVPYRYNVHYQFEVVEKFSKPDLSYGYKLPFLKGRRFKVQQAHNGVTHNTESHSQYAVDFSMPENSVVCAARGGLVVAFRDDSFVGGAQARYALYGNYLYVKHNDNTYGCYWHLRHNGILVPLGAHVKEGEPIALSGATGQAMYPHLHFNVMGKMQNGSITSIPVKFVTDNGIVTPVTGQTLGNSND